MFTKIWSKMRWHRHYMYNIIYIYIIYGCMIYVYIYILYIPLKTLRFWVGSPLHGYYHSFCNWAGLFYLIMMMNGPNSQARKEKKRGMVKRECGRIWSQEKRECRLRGNGATYSARCRTICSLGRGLSKRGLRTVAAFGVASEFTQNKTVTISDILSDSISYTNDSYLANCVT